jgi:hypothetical protein
MSRRGDASICFVLPRGDSLVFLSFDEDEEKRRVCTTSPDNELKVIQKSIIGIEEKWNY